MDIKKEKKEEGKMMEQKDGKEGRPWKRPNLWPSLGDWVLSVSVDSGI
jgi:hypothetical protein